MQAPRFPALPLPHVSSARLPSLPTTPPASVTAARPAGDRPPAAGLGDLQDRARSTQSACGTVGGYQVFEVSRFHALPFSEFIALEVILKFTHELYVIGPCCRPEC